MKITFLDSGREPRVAPNPKFPDGIDVDLTDGKRPTCDTALPYPAKRCGAWLVECEKCGYRAAITCAGRPDDPRGAKLPCKPTFLDDAFEQNAKRQRARRK